MKLTDTLRKTGVMRWGVVSSTYKNGNDRPTELMMDGVYDADKDLVVNKSSTEKNVEDSKPTIKDGSSSNSNGQKRNWTKIIGVSGAVIFALIVLSVIFGTPSAESVFDDSLDVMLQTESVTIKQQFSGSGTDLESIEMESLNYIELDSEDLKASGTFSLDLVTGGVPLNLSGKYIAVDGNRYLNIEKLESSDAQYNAEFLKIENSLKGKWVIARDSDNFTSFVDVPIDALTELTALPYAYVEDEVRAEILSIMREEESFVIVESSKVNVDGVDAYRYELEFDEENQAEVANKLREASGYFSDASSDDSSRIDSFEVWIDIDSKRIIKMTYSGTTSNGNIEATVSFDDYNIKQDVNKPDEYFIESELLN